MGAALETGDRGVLCEVHRPKICTCIARDEKVWRGGKRFSNSSRFCG